MKEKLIATGLAVASVTSMGASLGHGNAQHKTADNKELTVKEVSAVGQYASVVNGNNDLVVTNSQGKIIGYMSVGQMLKITGETPNSYKVQVQETGVEGFVAKSNAQIIKSGVGEQLIKEDKAGQIINVSSAVNMRAEATMQSKVLGTLADGQHVQILGKEGQWYLVQVQGQDKPVYIYENYVAAITTNGSVPVPAVHKGSDGVVRNTINTSQPSTIPSKVSNKDIVAKPIQSQGQAQNQTSGSKSTNTQHKDNSVQHKDNSVQHKDDNVKTSTGFNKPISNTTPAHKSDVTPSHSTDNKQDSKPVDNGRVHGVPEHSENHQDKTQPTHTTGSEVHGQPEHKDNTSDKNQKHDSQSTDSKESHDTNTTNKDQKHNSQSTDNKDQKHDSQQGSHSESKPVVKAPALTANNVTIQQGQPFADSMLNAKASEGATITYSGHVDTTTPGNYTITVTATKDGLSTVAKVTVTVTAKPADKPVVKAPTLTANNITIQEGSNFSDSMLKAQASEGAKITYEGTVNTQVPGVYHVTVKATKDGVSTVANVTVTVKAKPAVKPEQPIKPSQPIHDGSTNTGDTPDVKPVQPAKPVQPTKPADKPVQPAKPVQPTKPTQPVKEAAPVITGHNVTINVGSNYDNSMLGVSATEGAKVTYSGDVNTNTPGKYKVTVTATNSQGTSSEATYIVKVSDVAPTLIAHNYTMTQGQSFNLSDLDITATSATGTNLASKVEIVSGSVDVNTPGTYNLTLSVTDQYGETSTTKVTVTVKVKPEAAPVITAQNITLTQGQSFDNSMLKASTNESDAKLTYSGNVDTNKPGKYNVTITATNSQGVSSTDTVTVTIKAKPVQAQVKTIDANQGIYEYKGTKYYKIGGPAWTEQVNKDLFNDINQFRESQGLKAFKYDNDLQYMANWKANDCMTHNYYEHKDLQGKYTNQVFQDQIKLNAWNENLADGVSIGNYDINQVDPNAYLVSSDTISQTAKDLFNEWEQSPGHRANMLSTQVTNMGVAVATGHFKNNTASIIAAMDAGQPVIKTTINPITLQPESVVNTEPAQLHNPTGQY